MISSLSRCMTFFVSICWWFFGWGHLHIFSWRADTIILSDKHSLCTFICCLAACIFAMQCLLDLAGILLFDNIKQVKTWQTYHHVCSMYHSAGAHAQLWPSYVMQGSMKTSTQRQWFQMHPKTDQVVTALPLNGGIYNLLLNSSTKQQGPCLSVLLIMIYSYQCKFIKDCFSSCLPYYLVVEISVSWWTCQPFLFGAGNPHGWHPRGTRPPEWSLRSVQQIT